MQFPSGSVQASRQSSASHFVVQTVASLLQSSMQWCRDRWFSENRFVSAAAAETAARISRAGIEMARVLERDITAVLRFAVDPSRHPGGRLPFNAGPEISFDASPEKTILADHVGRSRPAAFAAKRSRNFVWSMIARS
jgi:hypothetical protein